ncbi:ABC transporter permease [Radiobacillus kanasensis]|uniref:ABC transporter permease n=1 Tax=Radiobacillus kanasensis TaxID=2844358 RepID=UPI001E4AEDBD|nr:ABC transporter permease [Radiobacillus kanasensis]UFT99735.1 ABC transporter permease [Radiobacillus kanasensis]
MSNFLKLLVNEQIKLYVRKSTWAMYILLAVVIIGLATIAQIYGTSTEEYGDDWRTELKEENKQLAKDIEEISGEEFADAAVEINQEIIDKNNYHLEHDIKPALYDGWQFVLENQYLTSILSLFTIIVAAGIVASEFRWGTIKLLLIRPVSRLKILLSKYVSVLLFALTTLLFLLLFSLIVGSIFFGFRGINPEIVQMGNNGFEQVSLIGEIVEGYGFKLVTLVMMATFAFMISTIFRNSGFAIGLAIFLMMAGNSIKGVLSQYDWSKYVLFANTDLTQYTDGHTPFMEGMTLTFSIVVLLVYYLVFMVLSWISFTKRDVAGH